MIRLAASTLIWNDPRGPAFGPWLEEVRALGYDGVSGFAETGWAEHVARPAEFRRVVEAAGLVVASLAGGLHGDLVRRPRVADFMAETGCREMVLIGSAGDDYADLAANAAVFNRVAEMFAARGVQPAYHNSSKPRPMTFAEMTALMDRADPTLTRFMCDTGHATRDFQDLPLAQRPVRYLERYWDRLAFIECKDYHPETDINTPVGEDLCPWAAFFALLRQRDYRGWLVVEQNGNLGLSRGRPPAECARLSRDFLRRGLGLGGPS